VRPPSWRETLLLDPSRRVRVEAVLIGRADAAAVNVIGATSVPACLPLRPKNSAFCFQVGQSLGLEQLGIAILENGIILHISSLVFE
jgi:hypothetical protein